MVLIINARPQGALTDKEPLQALRAPTIYMGMQGAPKDKNPCRHGDLNDLYRQGDPTDKASLHTRGPYRQGALTGKEFIETKGLYSK